MTGDVEDQERRDAFAFRHMRDSRVVAALRRVVAELFPVPKLRLRLAMHPATRLGGLNDGRHVVGVTVHRDTALEDGEGKPLGFQVALVGADEGGELRADGMAHDENTLRVAAVLRDVVMHPAEGLGDVAKDRRHLPIGQEAVTGGNKDEALVHEGLRLEP